MDRKKEYIDEIEGVLKYQKWLDEDELLIDYDTDDDVGLVLVSSCPVDYDDYEEYADTAVDGALMSYDTFCELNTTETWRVLPEYLSDEIVSILEGY